MTMAEQSGLVPVLVMSGETTPAKLDAWPVHRRPALIASHIGELLDWLA
jgi:hypothetical protein